MKCPDCHEGMRMPLLFGAPYPCDTCSGAGETQSDVATLAADDADRPGSLERAIAKNWISVDVPIAKGGDIELQTTPEAVRQLRTALERANDEARARIERAIESSGLSIGYDVPSLSIGYDIPSLSSPQSVPRFAVGDEVMIGGRSIPQGLQDQGWLLVRARVLREHTGLLAVTRDDLTWWAHPEDMRPAPVLDGPGSPGLAPLNAETRAPREWRPPLGDKGEA